MRKFGLVGGLSWHSTVDYYSSINTLVNRRNSDNTNPPLRLVSLNQKEVHDHQKAGDWDAIADILAAAVLELQALEVEGAAFCCNTAHKVFDHVQARVDVPMVHIADAMGERLQHDGASAAGILGTVFTMEEPFIKARLEETYGLTTLIPEPEQRTEVQRLFYDELTVGVFTNASREYFLNVIESLKDRGADSVVLACTEFPILLRSAEAAVPLVNSTECHVGAIVKFLLDDEPQ